MFPIIRQPGRPTACLNRIPHATSFTALDCEYADQTYSYTLFIHAFRHRQNSIACTMTYSRETVHCRAWEWTIWGNGGETGIRKYHL